MKYLIEHMDPEMWEWSQLEYRHVANSVGKENLIITNVKKKDISKIDFCEVKTESVSGMGLKRACVLDPGAEKTLEPADVHEFDHLIFGGILGNDPPEARTKDLIVPGANRRNLGQEQFSIDNAVMVAKQIIDGKRLAELKFTHDLVIEMDDGEEIILPFKYLVVDGKTFVSDKITEYVKEHGF